VSGATLTNSGAALVNKNTATLTNSGAALVNKTLVNKKKGLSLGATLTNSGVGTMLVNQGGATLTNSGAGTTLVNRSNATLTNSGAGTTLVNQGGATLTNSGSYTTLVNSGGAVLVTDTLYVRANDGLQWGAWTNLTTPFTASGGSQPSSVTVPAGGGVEIATAASSTNASFASNTGTLKLDDSRDYTGTVVGLVGQDSLDLADINYATVQTPTYLNQTSSGETVRVTDGTHTANIALLGNYMASVFTTSPDGNGGTNIVDPPILGGQPVIAPPHA
jgi:hypothetical protein